MKNKYIGLAKTATKIILFGDLLLAGILIVMTILWQVDISYFDHIQVENEGSIFKFTTSTDKVKFPLSQYGDLFYFVCFRALIVTGILFLILRTALQVLSSIDSLETFKSDNVKSFRRMGKLFIIWFTIAIPTIRTINDKLTMTIGFYLTYIVCALICFVLAEIFSEGNKLMEDNKLTI